MSAEPGPEQLVAELEIELPERLALGRGNAFVVAGHAHDPAARTSSLELELDGQRQPVDRFELPRSDVYERHGGSRSFKSGFVGVAAAGPRQRPGRAALDAVLALADGREARARLGELAVEPGLPAVQVPAAPAFPGGGGPRVAICMASFNPPGELLRRQLDSLRAQTHGNWVCVISDDASEPEALAGLEQEIAGDSRFALSRGPERLGFYRNFERALSMAPAEADYVALCDQDDFWQPHKLRRLLAGIGDARLIYSDARVIAPSGEVVHPSYWTERRNNHTNFGSLLLANSVTGAASLFPRELLDDALPFPQALARPFHDHWLAIVALALGRVAYVEEPLWDYVQHGGVVIGHSGANRRPRPVRTQLRERLRNPGDGSRVVYYYDWYQLLLYAKVLKLRCWGRMSRSKRRTVKRLLEADGGIAGLAWLLGRRLRRLWGRNETLDRELFYSYALLRRRAVSFLTLGRRRPGRRLPRDASIPPAPGQRGPA